jgi:F-type H+-transporting ATPase subunit delta
MSLSRVARRYARALLDAAAGSGREERIAADLEMLQAVIHGSAELRLLLKSPVVKRDKKQQALRAAFEGRTDQLTLEFISLLAEKGRESSLPQVVVEFRRLRNERLGIVAVDVSAATPLSAEQTESIRRRFEQITQKTVRVAVDVDPSLKGGFSARLGDTVYDGSIRRQLELLRQRFAAGEAV